MNNKKVLYLIIAALFVLVTALTIMLIFPAKEENSKAESDFSQLSEVSEISREISEDSAVDLSNTVSEDISEEISEEESALPEVSFVPSVPDDVSEPAEESSSLPDEETSILDEVSEEPAQTITVPQITVPESPDTAWDGNVATAFEKGSGTQTDPFVIATPAQLAFFRDTVNNGNEYTDQYISLSASICLSDIDVDNLPDESEAFWKGIGTNKHPFGGTFDGNGYAVYGIYGDGLFGTIQGSVKNVIIVNSYITSGGAIAKTASKNYNFPDNPTVILGCAVYDSIVCGSGGVVGYAGGYNVENCINTATVKGNGSWAGGIAGEFALGTMKDCFNLGSISSDTACGGIVGNAFNSSFTDCYNVGAVKGGGIAAVDYDSTFSSCGYSDTSAEYALKTSDGTKLTATNGIFIFTSDDIQKDNGRN